MLSQSRTHWMCAFVLSVLILKAQIHFSCADESLYSAEALRENLDDLGIRDDPLPRPLYENGKRCRNGIPSPYIGAAGKKEYKEYAVTHNKYYVPPTEKQQAELDKIATKFMGHRCKSEKCHFNPYGFEGGAWYPDQVCVNGSESEIKGRSQKSNVASSASACGVSDIFIIILNILPIMLHCLK